MNTIRVFPRRNSYTPTDDYAFYGLPPMSQFIPEHKEVHVSCAFTWEREVCEYLAYQWEGQTNKPVKLGGPAFGSVADDFIQGMYLKPNIIFTTRGCNNQCPWCIVPRLEGKLRELPVCQGNIIQDNNFLQASRKHKDEVFDMLKTQKGVCFKGGLDPELIDEHFTSSLQSLYYTRGCRKVSRIKELWLSCDTDSDLPKFKTAVEGLKKIGFNRSKIYSYALIGDNMEKNEARLREIYNAGAMPHAQLVRDYSDTKTRYSDNWNLFERMWKRPAAIKAHMEKGTNYWDYCKTVSRQVQ